MSGDELVTLVTRVWEAWSEPDYDTLHQLVAPDVRWSDGEGFDVPWRTTLGWEPLRELVEMIHAGGASRRHVVDAVARDDKVATMTFRAARQRWADYIGFDYF